MNQKVPAVSAIRKSRAPDGKPRTITTMRLDVALLQRLDTAAASEHRTRANMIEMLLDDALTKRGVKAAGKADNASVFG